MGETTSDHPAAVVEHDGEATVVGRTDTELLPLAVTIDLSRLGRGEACGMTTHNDQTVGRRECLMPQTGQFHVWQFLVPQV